jgi:hypothetical protein
MLIAKPDYNTVDTVVAYDLIITAIAKVQMLGNGPLASLADWLEECATTAEAEEVLPLLAFANLARGCIE